MPLEPLPYDRKEFFYKDRKLDTITAGDVIAGGNGTLRWREPSYRASPRRPPPSYYSRQNGGYYPQIYEEKNAWYGCTPSRSDAVHRQTSSRYYRGWQSSGSRDSRGSLPWSPYHSPYHEAYSPTSPAILRQISSPLPLFNKASPSRSAEIDKRRSDVMSWKALKWSGEKRKAYRSEDETCRNLNLEDSKVDSAKDKEVEAVDEEMPKKKSRLTWGQGLAKYEKQKVVEGSSNNSVSELSAKVAGSTSPETPCSAPPCVSSGANEVSHQPFSKAGNVVTDHQPFSKSTDFDNEENHQPLNKSAYMDSDVSDQPFINISNFESDDNHHCQASLLSPKNCSEQFPIKLYLLPSTSELTSLLDDLLQPEEACTGDSTLNKYIAPKKLELLKVKIPKELEKTEYEIELLENELKSLNSERENHISSPKFESFSAPSDLANVAVPVNLCDRDVLSKESNMEIFSVENECEVRHTNELSNVIEVSKVTKESIVGADKLDMSSVNMKEANFIDLIMASNKDAAKNAFQEFDRFMPAKQQKIDIWDSDFIMACRKNDIYIKERLAVRKKQLKIKERVLAIKFKTLHQIWKEDLHLLSVKKQRSKSQKCAEFCSRSLQNISQKQHTSSLSRFTSPGNLALVPPKNIEESTISSKLLESHAKLYRTYLKMPALILDESDRKFSKFLTSNNLIEDPLVSEKERAIINPWTQEEKRIFMEMLAAHGKDFAKISSFLAHKTTADCVEFYYKNHKLESFSDVKKLRNKQKQSQTVPVNTYMLTSGSKKWNGDSNAASPDMLGSVSVTVANSTGNSPKNQLISRRRKVSRTSFSSLEISGHEKENEVASSCVTSTISPSEKMTTPDANQTIEEEEDTCSDEDLEAYSVDWTDEEKSLFIRALNLHGKDFTKISHFVETKSREQCRIFFSKARKSLGLDSINPGGNSASPTICGNGGRSDTDESVSNTGGKNSLQNEIKLSTIKTEKQSVESCDYASNDTIKPETSHEVKEVNNVEAEVELGKKSCTLEEQMEEAQTTTDEIEAKTEVEVQVNMESDKSCNASTSTAKEPDSYSNHIFDFSSTSEQPVPQKLLSCSQKKSKHENIYSVPLTTVLPNPSSTCKQSTFNFNEHLHKDLYQHCLSSINLNCHTDQSAQILSGFPLNREKPKSILNENHFSNIYVSGAQFDRNGLIISNTEKQSNGTGNVKIFGQILKVEGSGKLEGLKQSNFEDIPIQKSYGFWDGTQIKTGFSSLPESTIISASSQGINNNSNSQQACVQPLSSNGKRSGLELVSGFQPRSATPRLGVNFVNGSGISDPVAALKLAKLYSGGVESWSPDLNGR